jgi:hypothetical protein
VMCHLTISSPALTVAVAAEDIYSLNNVPPGR